MSLFSRLLARRIWRLCILGGVLSFRGARICHRNYAFDVDATQENLEGVIVLTLTFT